MGQGEVLKVKKKRGGVYSMDAGRERRKVNIFRAER